MSNEEWMFVVFEMDVSDNANLYYVYLTQDAPSFLDVLQVIKEREHYPSGNVKEIQIRKVSLPPSLPMKWRNRLLIEWSEVAGCVLKIVNHV